MDSLNHDLTKYNTGALYFFPFSTSIDDSIRSHLCAGWGDLAATELPRRLALEWLDSMEIEGRLGSARKELGQEE
jgi:hypothetical protein